MELKRFVLLSDNTILDKTKEIYYVKGENELYRDRPNAVLVTVRIGIVKKTSDNILDLLEVGDLVETDGDIMNVQGIYENEISLCRDFVDKTEIKAIYKRQTNGDYVRYEVKGDL